MKLLHWIGLRDGKVLEIRKGKQEATEAPVYWVGFGGSKLLNVMTYNDTDSEGREVGGGTERAPLTNPGNTDRRLKKSGETEL